MVKEEYSLLRNTANVFMEELITESKLAFFSGIGAFLPLNL